MQSYLNLLRDVLENGEDHNDRTGVGTRSVFGRQWRHDMRTGFPLLTTKRVFARGTFEELKWFLSGSTNVNDLGSSVQAWWKPWADEKGNLGPVYGRQLRSSRSFSCVVPLIFDTPSQEEMDDATKDHEKTFLGVGCIGGTSTDRGQDPEELILKDVWRDMIERCYSESSYSYKSYGGKGVHVSPNWLVFDNFSADAKSLDGWNLKRLIPGSYSLDKDVKFASNRYSKETCKWSSHEEQSFNTSTNKAFFGYHENGTTHVFPSIGDASRTHGLNLSAVHRCLNGKLKTHHGWRFEYIEPQESSVIRVSAVDQIASILADLTFNPNSRRIVATTWNPADIPAMALPCCHGTSIQLKAHADNTLSLAMFQRSADIFIGVPVNIASYAMLLEMLCFATGRIARDLVISFADLHLYNNHVEQARTQLVRDPYPLPTIIIDAHRKSSPLETLLGIEWHDVLVNDYKSHPKIEAPVAV